MASSRLRPVSWLTVTRLKVYRHINENLRVEKRRPLLRQPNDHNFGSLIMLAVTAGAAGQVDCDEGSFLLPAGVAIR
jgi:hypothetical protein